MTVVYYLEVNLICIFILSILLINVIKPNADTKVRFFRGMLISAICLCLSDLFAGIFRGNMSPGMNVVLWISNILYFVSSLSIAVFWVLYSLYVLFGRVKKAAWIITASLASISAMMFVTTPLHGLAFTINESNLYERGPLIWVNYAFVLPCLIIPSLIAVFTKAEFKIKHAVIVFPILPIASTLIQILNYGTTLSQAGATCALLMLYVMLQSQVVIDAVSRAEKLDKLSYSDSMTGLRNRRAFEEKIDELRNEEWIGVIFADLNGLKRVNDSKGHKAGDQMIIHFSDMLKDFFSADMIFRISGDEFVVFLVDKEHCADIVEDLKICIGDLAAVGFGDGRGVDAVAVLGIAEKDMYKVKGDYYVRSGLNRRR